MKNYQKELKNLKNKEIMKKLLITILTILSFLSCDKNKDQYAAVDIKFEGLEDAPLVHAWVIETERNDTSVRLDTVIQTQLHKVNKYTIELEFKTESLNGDYLIYADSIKGVNMITDVIVNKDFTFTYLFNGIPKTEKDHYLIIIRNNQ